MSDDRFRKDYGIECPVCKNTYAKIQHQSAALHCQKRVRSCKKCGNVFTTYERIENRDYALRDRNFKNRMDNTLTVLKSLIHDINILKEITNEKTYEKSKYFTEPRESNKGD